MTRRTLLLAAVGAALGGIDSFQALFAPSADPWPRWERHDPQSERRIDHGAWQALLTRRTRLGEDGIRRVDYGDVTAEERAALEAYLARLAATPVSALARPEQRAFWINLYNALTVRVVLDHYPVVTIRDIDISPGLFASGPWGAELVEVEDEPLSLNDIEHRILRPIWRDPRVHYAVNCAALGCPNLRGEAFSAANTEALMEAGARDFVNHPRGARFAGSGLRVSSLYAWYAEDFGSGDDAGILAHLRRYAEPALAARLEEVESIDDHAYDWSLNDL